MTRNGLKFGFWLLFLFCCPAASAMEPMALTIDEAMVMAIENNRSLMVERLHPDIRRTYESEEAAVFDPVLSGNVSARREESGRMDTGSAMTDIQSDGVEGAINLYRLFPSGTTVSLSGEGRVEEQTPDGERLAAVRLGIDVGQPLARGFGARVNRVRVRQAMIDTAYSEYELRGFTESLAAETAAACWDLALAERQMEIVEESLALSRRQLKETEDLIAVGRLAEAELPAARAEVALQEQEAINSRSHRDAARIQLLRLLNPPGPFMWGRPVRLKHPTEVPLVELADVERHVAVSRDSRPLLNQARLQVLRDDLELVRTRNGLLPYLELFVTLGKSGYADAFGGAVSDLPEDRFDAQAGIRGSYPLYNREARSLERRARLGREQSEKALENLLQLVEVDVRLAHMEVGRTRQQIDASSATRALQEEKLRIESEKYRVGRSTSFLVAQAQRDLLASRIAEVRAVAQYLKALIALYAADGSLLERKGIEAPGNRPVTVPPS